MRATLLALLWAAFATVAGAATLTPEEMRATALTALAEGDARTADAIATALLDRYPADEAARAIRSRAARELGRYDTALGDARRAWTAAGDDAARYRAALLQAQALASRGNRLRAQLWLRRAAELAPTAGQRVAAIRDLRYVRARDPVGLRLTFGITPTDNVNNGSTRTEVDYLGDTRQPVGTSRALSGTRHTFGGALDIRLHQTRNVEDHAQFTVLHQATTLSDEARRLLDEDLAPGIDPATGAPLPAPVARSVDGRDFDYSALRVGLERQFTTGPGRGLFGLSAELGKDWYGHDPYTTFLGGAATARKRIAPRSTAEISLTARYLDRDRGDGAGVRRVGAGLVLDHRLDRGRLSLGAGLSGSDSDAIPYDYREVRVSARYAHGTPILGAVVSVEAALSATDFGDWPFLLGAPLDDLERRDVTLSVGIDATLPGLGRYGFAPVVSLDATDRRSNVDIYEYDQVGIGIGLRSVF